MRRKLLTLLAFVTATQISSIAKLETTCDAKTVNRCKQMPKSGEAEENDEMGQRLGLKSGMEEEVAFPETLEEFGYHFNADGQMRHTETGEPFKFEVKEGDRAYNQRHYEALGEVITEYVYKLLEEEVKLEKHFVPVDAKEDEARSFIFMSKCAMTSDKLMILIHGSGVVRAGQWARRLIINDDLNCGTMLPYIKRAEKDGFGVLITNGNENFGWDEKKRIPIRGSESPEKHFRYVWENFISKAAAEKIVVVAHSYGGIVIVNGLQKCKGLLDKVKAVAFTDSVHSLPHQGGDKTLLKWMKKNSRNWISSDRPLDSPVESVFRGADCDMVSAGTERHELTSHFAFDSVFKFFDERLSAQNEPDISDNQEEASKTQADEASKTQTDEASKTQTDEASKTQTDESSKTQADEASKTQTDEEKSTEQPTSEQNGASENKPEPTQGQEESEPMEVDSSL
ncbi:cotranscriptional regulator ARB2A homolog isoform X1 [Montipora capricornis]|uniref:cotranscriptional regulator ARB2A homolog isoform X1 n=2 Tax=Montipora capricornis TaxID=246305 RepID=UPI0035F204F7